MPSSFFFRPLWLLAALASPCAQATRPMVVDDASIASEGKCQVESWIQHAAAQTEYWAVPACNAGANWELAAGVGRIEPDGAGGTYHAGFLQAKTVFRPLQKNGWGIGLTVANQFRAGGSLAGDLSVLVPVSVSLLDDRVLVHANGGWLHAHASGRDQGFWATGTEWAAWPRLTLTLEAYATGRAAPFGQAGVRLAVVPDRLAVDAGVGNRAGAEHYFTIGLTVAGKVLR